ncbi:MAG: Response regulator protein TodT [Prosthecobacter sp.]|nr:Response regulator protein TodT [Prosthecobacter sp.]
MSPATPVVFIVDDDPSICRSLLRLVRQTGFEGHSYGSAEEFIEVQKGPLMRPACLVVDLQMPGLSGLELQQHLQQGAARCPMIFISGNGDIPSTVRAMKHGAVTFLTKPFDNADLLRAIGEALERHRAELSSDRQVRQVRDRMAELTERELQVMSWVITGALNKQIAAELDIVEKTVKVHRARVLEKMQAQSVAELVRLCSLAGFAAATSGSAVD